jgi:hypothetical protein
MKKLNTPIKHHYIPQHFLKAWEVPEKKGSIYRYRIIKEINKFECKLTSIKNTAFEKNLYDVNLPDGNFEFESSVVTPMLDEIGKKVLNKIRNTSIRYFSNQDHKDLAVYITCLEARHPEILEAMNIVPELNSMGNSILTETTILDDYPETILTPIAIYAIIEY